MTVEQLDIETIVKCNMDLSKYSFEDLIYCGRICDQVEQFDWMLIFVDEIINRARPLNFDERNMVSVSFKNTVGPARTSWRIAESICRREIGKNQVAENDSQLQHIKKIKKQCERNVEKICTQILERLEKKIMPVEADEQAQIFYLKMQGDYYRYIAEVHIEQPDSDKA